MTKLHSHHSKPCLLLCILLICTVIVGCGGPMPYELESSSNSTQTASSYDASSSTKSLSQTETSSQPEVVSSDESSSQSEPVVLPKDLKIEKTVGKYGNLPGNLHNGGNAAYSDGLIYYTNGTGLYKVKNDGTGQTKLCSDVALYINVYDDWVYYCNSFDYYRIGTDGYNKQLYVSNALYLTVANGWVYYIDRESESLYRMKPDKTSKSLVAKNAYWGNMCIHNDKIYWGNNIDLTIVNVDGTGLKTYDDIGSQGLVIYDGIKYTSGSLVRENIDGSASRTLIKSGAMDITIMDDWIYFNNSADNHSIYKIRTDGTNMQKLNDIPTIAICAVGDWIFYRSMVATGELSFRGDKYYKMRLDGSENQLLK